MTDYITVEKIILLEQRVAAIEEYLTKVIEAAKKEEEKLPKDFNEFKKQKEGKL